MKGIKLKLVYLWYDYLQYKRTKLGTKLFRLDKKIDALEVKYMGVEPTTVDWSKIEQESDPNIIIKIEDFQNN
jgi:hypothetical protein